jgi:hypothetical protein
MRKTASFHCGAVVECRNAGDEGWKTGKVTTGSPLRVLPDGWKQDKDEQFHEVRWKGQEEQRLDTSLAKTVVTYEDIKKAHGDAASEEVVRDHWDRLRPPPAETLTFLMNFLESKQSSCVDLGNLFDEFATEVLDKLDVGDDGWVTIGEVFGLYDEVHSRDLKVQDFSEWLHRYHKFEKIEDFWAELSDTMDIDTDEFQTSMKHVLGTFIMRSNSALDASVGESIFEEHVVTMKSAIWQMPESTRKEDRSKRLLKVKFECTGSMITDPDKQTPSNWIIKVHGKADRCLPAYIDIPERFDDEDADRAFEADENEGNYSQLAATTELSRTESRSGSSKRYYLYEGFLTRCPTI